VSWDDELGPSERKEWDRFVAYQREVVLKQMIDSAFVMSLVPDPEKFDVKFALETGMAVLLGKPIILLVQPGGEIPGKLRLVADRIIECDIDTEDGKQQIAHVIEELSLKGGEP
jgi:hypothetical protein